MITAADVTAIIPTRGDVDLTKILDRLPYDEVIVTERTDVGCFSRYLAITQAKHDTIYFQDDDLVFTEHDKLLAAHNHHLLTHGEDPTHCSVFTSNMPSPWWEEQYARKDMALVGAGSLVPRDLPWAAFGHYLAVYPRDELFHNYCDMVHGVLTPYNRLNLGYRILPHAGAPGRICTTEGADVRKDVVIKRALEIRNRR